MAEGTGSLDESPTGPRRVGTGGTSAKRLGREWGAGAEIDWVGSAIR
jgi:hypothetical protein